MRINQMRKQILIVVLVLISQTAYPQTSKYLNQGRARLQRALRYSAAAADRPYSELAVHSINNVQLTVSNFGLFGTGPLAASIDPVTGEERPSCIYPARSNIEHLYVGGFWIGAVVGRDTLVSIGIDDYYAVQELWPDPFPDGEIQRRSITTTSPYYSEDAKSELDIVAVYTDTVTNPNFVSIDDTDGRPHVPLNIEVTQSSYTWSYEYAEDFILFDYAIKNIGRKTLEKVYMAIYIDGDVHHTSAGPEGYLDDICGFRRTFPSPRGCGFLDTINVAYIMDNDGDPSEDGDSWTNESARSLAGVRVVRTPSDSLEYSFNWWATDYGSASRDFGPRQVGTESDPFRDMNGVLGTPLGDKNKYYVMRHREFDYDQLFTDKDHTADGWLPKPLNAVDISNGYDERYLLSFGPFNIYPGEVLPVTFAFVCASGIHVNPRDFEDKFNPQFPEDYYASLDFSDLAENSTWASWIYDNPGVDTDNDGDSGKVRICINDIDTVGGQIIISDADTFFYAGDGVPDFKGASPPPPPDLWLIKPYPIGDTIRSLVTPAVTDEFSGEVTIDWYGYRTENTKDVFSNEIDFEGYRVWKSLSDRPDDFTLLASYDKIDFNKYVYNPAKDSWELHDPPFTLDSLHTLYGNNLNPLDFPRERPYVWQNDSSFYFSPQDWNQSDLTDTLEIHKIYPDQPRPSTLNHDSAAIYYPDELTEDGYFKYYMYRFVAKNLLPSQKYYFAVTTFDYGSPGHGLTALETKPIRNYVSEYPQNSAEKVMSEGLNVVVYPNPYRADAGYRIIGFEGRGEDDLPDDRVRALHFTNLPNKCMIRIFSIDGDLVREIDHDFPPGSPRSMHDTWDLITRNTQAAVSGIYYYSVESESGSQIGKFVLIM